MNLYLECNSWTRNVGEIDPDDSWSRYSTSTDWSFGHKLSNIPSYESLDVTVADGEYETGDTVYLTVAVWSTGDSFGNDDGYDAEIMSLHKDKKEAYQAAQKMESGEKGELGNGYEFRYCPWVGYFESLDYIEVVEATVIIK